MRLALDEQIFAVQKHGGISRLFFEMARAFANTPELDLELEPLNAPIINEYVLGDGQLRDLLGVSPARGPYSALAHYFGRMRKSSTVDLVHNTFYLPRGLSEFSAAKRVVTIYDMIPEILPKSRRRLDFITKKRAYVQHADHIICISESTRRDLLRIYPEVRVPISIAYPGVSPQFTPSSHCPVFLPVPYILHMGNRSDYKDASTLFRAFAAISRTVPDFSLLLVGGGSLTRDERLALEALGISERVQQRTLADVDVPFAYSNAAVTVFPSRYEGFGLPAVEAMAAGSPLLLAHTSSLPEVGGSAAQYFPVGSDVALAQLLREVLFSDALRSEMRREGFKQARRFTWPGYALANADAYRYVLGMT